jgi:hypothetical protein
MNQITLTATARVAESTCTERLTLSQLENDYPHLMRLYRMVQQKKYRLAGERGRVITRKIASICFGYSAAEGCFFARAFDRNGVEVAMVHEFNN